MADDRDLDSDLDGGPPVSPATRARLDDARHHLDAARRTAAAGTEVPEQARMRQVKRAVNLGLRPVTSQQVPFNHELVMTVERLGDVVADLMATLEAGLPRSSEVPPSRVAAALATVEVGQAEVEDEIARLAAEVASLAERVAAAEALTIAQRQALGAARVREEVLLRAARDAVAAADVDAARQALAPLAAAADESDLLLVHRLRSAADASPEERRAQADALAEVVAGAAGGAPVVDLDAGRGDWLDHWRALGLDASGSDADPAAVELLVARGHRVVAADPLAHLGTVAPGSLGAVTATDLVDRLSTAELLALVDALLLALQPGGAAVLLLAAPGALAAGSRAGIDPRRRPLHPDALVVLLLERGAAEVDVVELGGDAWAVIARTPGGTAR